MVFYEVGCFVCLIVGDWVYGVLDIIVIGVWEVL